MRPAAATSGPGTAQTTARSPGPRGVGAGAVGPEQQRHARFRPARLRGGRGGPTIPFWLRGRAGRGGAGRVSGNNFLFGPLCLSPLAAGRGRLARKPEAGSGSGNVLPWHA